MANGFKVDNATGAPGVQPWSRGAIFPLVIARRERYWGDGSITLMFDVLNADDDMAGFASYDDALEAAKGWLGTKAYADYRGQQMREGKAYEASLSPFNPAAYDAELAVDLYGVS